LRIFVGRVVCCFRVELLVVDLFKNDSVDLVSPGRLITVARPGGEIQLGGVHYVAIDRNVPDWVEGQTYVLLLRSSGVGTSFFLVTDDGLVYIDDYQHRSELPDVLKTMSTAGAIHWIASAAAPSPRLESWKRGTLPFGRARIGLYGSRENDLQHRPFALLRRERECRFVLTAG
jgi:hypothetical protein